MRAIFGVALVVACLAVAIVVYSSVSAQPGDAATELKQLQDRVRALGANPPEAEWKKVTDALEGWARKHRAQTTPQERAKPPGGGLSPCPRTVDGPPGFYCYYASSDRGKCYSTCVKL